MNKVTEQLIEEKLKKLASIEPSTTSRQRMKDHVRQAITGLDTRQPNTRGFSYYAIASAAMLLIGIGLLYDHNPTPPSPIANIYPDTDSKLTLAKLNNVFNQGGQKALDEYFEKIESHRQPRAETITLQELLAEL